MARKKVNKKKWLGGGKWSTPEKNYIIKLYHLEKTHIEVKRAMREKFGYSRKIKNTHAPHFYKVFENFDKKGPFKHHQKCDMPKKQTDAAKIDTVKTFFDANPQTSTENAKHELQIPKPTVIFKKVLKYLCCLF